MQEMRSQPAEFPELKASSFDFRSYFFNYVLRYWYIYAATLLCAFAAAYFYNWYVTPIYKATCSVLVKEPNNSGDASDFLMHLDNYSTDRNIQNEIEILRSRTLLSRTIQELNLEVSYYLEGNVKTSELYKEDCPLALTTDSLRYAAYSTPLFVHVLDAGRFELSYNNERGAGEVKRQYRFGQQVECELGTFVIHKSSRFNEALFNNPAHLKRDFIVRFNSFENLISRYGSSLKVAPINKQASILEMSLDDPVAAKAVDFLDKLIEVWIRSSIEEKNQIIRNSLEFIDEQLALISKDLTEIETTLEKFKTEKGITDLGAEAQSYLGSLREYDSRISEIELKISFLNYLEGYVKQSRDIKELSPSSIGIDDPILLKLMNQLSDLEGKRSLLLMGAREDNPAIQAINAQSRNIRSLLLETIKSTREGLLASKRQAFSQLDRIEGKIRVIPGSQRQLLNIQRQNQLKESLYTYLMQKRAENAIVLASTTSDNRIVDDAHATFSPVRPVRSQTYIIALFLGLLLPLTFIYGKDVFNDRIKDRDQLEQHTRIPLLGIVGYSKDPEEIVIKGNPKSHISESFRSIRTNLQYYNPPGNKCNVVLITSSVSAEGKSFCALNLAAVIALSGQKTVLLGFDLRKPKSPGRFDLKGETGISNFLIGSATLPDIAQPSGVPNLHIILSGPKPPNPSELMMNGRMDELFDQLRNEYDYVIIDSPPLGIITDAMLLTRFANAVVYVVRQNITHRHHLDIVNKLYSDNRIKNLSILFNAVRSGTMAHGGSYGYGYGRGYGYYDEDKGQKSFFSRIFRS
jgi:tyrosine-protein kinase Etk/Wzc